MLNGVLIIGFHYLLYFKTLHFLRTFSSSFKLFNESWSCNAEYILKVLENFQFLFNYANKNKSDSIIKLNYYQLMCEFLNIFFFAKE